MTVSIRGLELERRRNSAWASKGGMERGGKMERRATYSFSEELL